MFGPVTVLRSGAALAEAPAPDGLATSRLRPRGSSQGGLRQYNERVVLQAVRLHGALAAADIARISKLTAQTVSLITKRLLDDGLLLKGEQACERLLSEIDRGDRAGALRDSPPLAALQKSLDDLKDRLGEKSK